MLTKQSFPIAALLLAAACTGRGEGATEASLPTLAILADDYRFTVPASVPAGRMVVQLVNQGHELHHVQLVRIEAGHTLQDLDAAVKVEGPPPPWVTMLGGPNGANPGETKSAIETLTPGQYAVMCWIPSLDGVPHVAKGMMSGFAVTEAGRPTIAEPAADIQVTLSDYTFTFAPEVLTGGRKTLRIGNTATQPHEMVLFKYLPGKGEADLGPWLAAGFKGEAPGQFVGGVTALGWGAHNEISVDFTPGDYALICFVPDVQDGKPHLMHGMIRQMHIPGASSAAAM